MIEIRVEIVDVGVNKKGETFRLNDRNNRIERHHVLMQIRDYLEEEL